MNKLSKIFLVIIITLVIALGIMVYLYFDVASSRDKYMNSNEKAVTELYKKTLAIEKAGLEVEVQEDGSFVLVKQKTPIERVGE